MKQDVIKFVTSCQSCQTMKSDRQLQHKLLQPLPIPTEKWESMDFIVSLPRTSTDNTLILVIVNRFSKMTHFISWKKANSAPYVASLFKQHIFRIHG